MITQEFMRNSAFAQELYQQAARAAAAEAVECLWSIYWEHTFDGQILVEQIEAIIMPILNGALPLEVPAYDEANDKPLTPVRVYPRPGASDRPASIADIPITEWRNKFYATGTQG